MNRARFLLVTLFGISAIFSVDAQSTCLNFNRSLYFDLKDSTTGGLVSPLQNYLYQTGLLKGSPTGRFGPATVIAVKEFQKQNGITQNGVFGPQTRKALASITCNGKKTESTSSQATTTKVATTVSAPTVTSTNPNNLPFIAGDPVSVTLTVDTSPVFTGDGTTLSWTSRNATYCTQTEGPKLKNPPGVTGMKALTNPLPFGVSRFIFVCGNPSGKMAIGVTQGEAVKRTEVYSAGLTMGSTTPVPDPVAPILTNEKLAPENVFAAARSSGGSVNDIIDVSWKSRSYLASGFIVNGWFEGQTTSPVLTQNVGSGNNLATFINVPVGPNKLFFTVDAVYATSSMRSTASPLVQTTTLLAPSGIMPTVSVTANPSTVYQGNQTTIAWTSENAGYCTLPDGTYSKATNITSGYRSGTIMIAPVSSTSYTFYCTNVAGDLTATSTVSITVNPAIQQY